LLSYRGTPAVDLQLKLFCRAVRGISPLHYENFPSTSFLVQTTTTEFMTMASLQRRRSARDGVAKKPKGGTPSSRKHHFESFSQRIAKLKIEPVRRGRSALLDDAELDTTFSYFSTALVEWKDINVSGTFTVSHSHPINLASGITDTILDICSKGLPALWKPTTSPPQCPGHMRPIVGTYRSIR
jgi:hypothetical protein